MDAVAATGPAAADFRFTPLTRRVAWGELARLDVADVVADRDTATLAARATDVMFGDAKSRGGYADDGLMKACQMAQLTTQYLYHSQDALRHRITSLEATLKHTQMQLDAVSEQRRDQARTLRRMRQESKSADALIESYQIMLASLNPELAAKVFVRQGELVMRRHRRDKTTRVVLAEKQTQANVRGGDSGSRRPAPLDVGSGRHDTGTPHTASLPVASPAPSRGFPSPMGPPPVSAASHPPPGALPRSPAPAASSAWSSPLSRSGRGQGRCGGGAAATPSTTGAAAGSSGARAIVDDPPFARVDVSAVSEIAGSPRHQQPVTLHVGDVQWLGDQRPPWFSPTADRRAEVVLVAVGDGVNRELWTSDTVQVPTGQNVAAVRQRVDVPASTVATLHTDAPDLSFEVVLRAKLRTGTKRLAVARLPYRMATTSSAVPVTVDLVATMTRTVMGSVQLRVGDQAP